MSAATEPQCPRFAWCDADHSKDAIDAQLIKELGEFHRETGVDRYEVGVLRTDHAYENEVVSLSICDSIDWHVPANESTAFFTKLRAAIDEAEQRFEDFKAQVRTVTRRTEPGQPQHEEVVC